MTEETSMTVESIMTKDVLTLKPLDPFALAQAELKRVPFHHLLIANSDQTLAGVISDRDMMGQLATFINEHNSDSFAEFLPKLKISDVMTKDVITIDVDTTVSAASILLLENNFSCLPVIDETRKIQGIVTWKDLLKHYVYR
jgi:acetoin utilization protein AcuB